MKRGLRFNRVPLDKPDVTFTLHGDKIVAKAGDNLAAAVLSAGITVTGNTPVSGSPRAPYCMMGVCFECLMVVDGVPNTQSCMIEVYDGMSVERQIGIPSLNMGAPDAV